MISLFDMFKIGVGPSSSHTVGPMVAAKAFLDEMAQQENTKARIGRVTITLFGSLAATGRGHATDKAVLLGLMGFEPRTIDLQSARSYLEEVERSGCIELHHFGSIPFSTSQSILFDPNVLDPAHPNALHFMVVDHDGMAVAAQTYYSIGGGFIRKKGEEQALSRAEPCHVFQTANSLLRICQQQKTSIDQIMYENEMCWHTAAQLQTEVGLLWQAMQSCIARGLTTQGILPGGLNLPRRASKLYQRLTDGAVSQRIESPKMLDFYSTIDWVNAWALAVNEENAAGGRVVTAPTNGAAGIVPAVMMFASHTINGFDEDMVTRFLLTATAFGYLFKQNASISGAEVGCQGEVGSACAMAASGLACLMGGTPTQIENAAEIATEHNLGLTCDPVAGLVQVPCIERNAIAAVKAINAARMALIGDGQHFVSFDKVVKTLRETGADMQTKYKETSQGGLAVNTIEC